MFKLTIARTTARSRSPMSPRGQRRDIGTPETAVDATAQFSDDDIGAGIKHYDDSFRPDAVTVSSVRENLSEIQATNPHVCDRHNRFLPVSLRLPAFCSGARTTSVISCSDRGCAHQWERPRRVDPFRLQHRTRGLKRFLLRRKDLLNRHRPQEGVE